MPEPHVHTNLRDVGARARAFAEAPLEDRLLALANLQRKASSSDGATWINASLAAVSIVTLFGATLVASYGIWTQGGIAYWTLQAQDISGEGGVQDQVLRWADASASILDAPNALAQGLTAWGAGLSLALIFVVIGGTIGKIVVDNSRRTAQAWIAVYDRVWPVENKMTVSSRKGQRRVEQRKPRRTCRIFHP